jgi:hypothetical protein
VLLSLIVVIKTKPITRWVGHAAFMAQTVNICRTLSEKFPFKNT